ncbi:phosphoethanolamine--lipid A transferase [Noviherbaspirillum sp.]|uniref:phosphoethanolamine transferase n=1 Tax=Noviherbaspirillum sp. TaxID=1926288 RepID=UPI002B48E791|nr:phosphoethanolamine--lipid A transferase [Noviherbaspirillum sp.]HJV82054.1 phosphoethanolamine--lipid A transferase [Noviherbaspirillum sp.]
MQNYSTFNRDKSKFHFRSPVTLALAISTIFLVFHNFRFWREAGAALWDGTLSDSLFMASLFLFLLFLHTAFLLLIPGRRLLQATTTILFIVAAAASYSADAYGVFIDKDMIRNLFETDQREAGALLNLRFAAYVFVLGVLPSLLLWRVRVQKIGLKRQLVQRSLFFIAGLTLSGLMLFAFSANYSSFVREHKNLRYLLSPGAAVQGTIQYARSMIPNAESNSFADTRGVTTRFTKTAHNKPLLMFLVVGETARGLNFQLGGYDRPTNPELAKVDGLYYFRNVSSCGTSTAISLPCMFSHLGQEHFSVPVAAHTTNLLDALNKAGVEVEWRDNNSGSKGVSARARTVSYDAKADATLCNNESCYDEVMLQGLDKSLRTIKDDTVFAFHQIGSHGPAYAKRYPQRFERFTPVCNTNELKQCSEEQIRNAYDNTIVYTDHNLAQQIAILKSVSDRFDTVLIYVSDHGESLGEKGLYLHGAPYMFAPEAQKRVPFILWMSDGYRQRFSLESACLRAELDKPFSHDNLYHTVLGGMGVKNAMYQSGMDIFAACRHNEILAGDLTASDGLKGKQ